MSKTCKGCGETKTEAEFYRSRRTRDGLRGKCRVCTLAECKVYTAVPENKKRKRDNERARGRSPEQIRRQRLWTWHRLRWEEYEALLESQGGVCKVCKNPEPAGHGRFHVDHDHNCCPTKKSCGKCIRGLLCSRCNPMIGMAKDDPEVLMAAAQYLAQVEYYARPNALTSALGAVGDV